MGGRALLCIFSSAASGVNPQRLDDREVPAGEASHQSSAIERLPAVPTAQSSASTLFFLTGKKMPQLLICPAGASAHISPSSTLRYRLRILVTLLGPSVFITPGSKLETYVDAPKCPWSVLDWSRLSSWNSYNMEKPLWSALRSWMLVDSMICLWVRPHCRCTPDLAGTSVRTALQLICLR